MKMYSSPQPQLNDLCSQIRVLLNPKGIHSSNDFDSIVSQANRLSIFHQIFNDFSLVSPINAKFLIQRINMPLTRQEVVSQYGFKYDAIADAEKKLLAYVLTSIEQSDNSKTYVFEKEVIPPPPERIIVIKPKTSSHKEPIISSEERAAKVKSLFLELKIRKGDEYASNILSFKEQKVLFDLILKDITLDRNNIYPISGCTRSQLLVVLRKLEERLQKELSL